MRTIKLYEEFKDQDFKALEEEIELLKYIIEDEGNFVVVYDRRSESDRTGKIITINIVHGLQQIPRDQQDAVEDVEDVDDILGGFQDIGDGGVNFNLLNRPQNRDTEDEINNLNRGQNNQRLNQRAHHVNMNPGNPNRPREHDPILTPDELYDLDHSPFYNEFCSRLLEACQSHGYTLIKKFFSSPDILIITDMSRRDYLKKYNHVTRAWYIKNDNVEQAPFQWQ